MKRQLFFLLLISMISTTLAKTQPGKSCLSAGLTNLGKEFGYGRMISPTTMLLAEGTISYVTTSEESTFGDTTSDGPQADTFEMTIYPEFRFYALPKAKATPYFGVYGLLGIGSSSSDEPSSGDISSTVTNMSSFSIGIGASFGVEFFFNEFVSIAANARVAQFYTKTEKAEMDNGYNTSEDVHKATSLQVQLQPALFVRIYF